MKHGGPRVTFQKLPPGRRVWQLLFWLALLITSLPVRAVDIDPPFGLDWGETRERMEHLITNAKGKIVERREVNSRVVWTVEGLVQTHLKRTLFHFRNGGLEEVELQYQNDQWSDTEYNTFLAQLRGRIEKRFGPGKLIARSKEPVDGDVTQTLVSYQWAKGQSAIELIYFSAVKSPDVYRTVSLHYRAIY
ncbi:MAG TPA: hypothetical protein VNQ90_11210 [Chthoniobacteraceae bacterium]|nr:hypothetical protein [Chthoniobacteraceae bacterium]